MPADSDHSPLSTLTPLLREINDLKRVRAAHFKGSYADRLFVDAWQGLRSGRDPRAVAMDTTARAVAATRLAGIDASALSLLGLGEVEIADVFAHALDDVGEAVPASLRTELIGPTRRYAGPVFESSPEFVAGQLAQPRAGATHPGKPRMILEPAESHADHCLTVAVYAVLVSPRFGGDPAVAFLAGLAHHLFNACLPDAGFNGDVVLQKAGVLDRVTEAAFDRAFDELDGLSPDLGRQVRHALAFTKQTAPPESECFHAADVFDRVLEMGWFARCSAFTLSDAVEGLDIVHVAPEQSFQRQALAEAGIWRKWPA